MQDTSLRISNAEAIIRPMQKNVSEKGISDKNPAGRREDPVGLRYALNVLYERYEKPLFIVENGFGAIDVKERDGSCDDSPRITYLKQHIQEMKKAVEEDGVDLMGYTPGGASIWSLLPLVR